MASALGGRPVVFEINTLPWLTTVAQRRGRAITLADIPPEAWDDVLPPGIDAVWLMGVWQRSPAGIDIARHNPDLQRSFREALPDYTDADLVGSPYCVRDYHVDPALGGEQGLAKARADLAERGLRLVLDYVPNHVAPDHPWVTEHPEHFIRGSADDAAANPDAWLVVGDPAQDDAAHGGNVLARGKDPYFAPWPDVVQLNAFDPRLRAATIETLSGIADRCDAVRCDMAMLLMNDIFRSTWGDRAGPVPDTDFWVEVIGAVKARHPDFVFIAEAYWDREWALQQNGFDFCYDKRLYDRLVELDAKAVTGHLHAGDDYQNKLIRFIENHDEPRAAATFEAGPARAAAVTTATVGGATLWHEGQFEGRRVRLPVFLGRFPDEPVDGDLRQYLHRLLRVVAEQSVRTGEWRLLEAHGWPDNQTYTSLLTWAWTGSTSLDGAGPGPDQGPGPDGAVAEEHGAVPHHVVVINLAPHDSQGLVPLPWTALGGATWNLTDALTDEVYPREGDQLVDPGLFVSLPPWGAHLLQVTPAPA